MTQPDILDHHGGPRPRGHDAPPADTGRFGRILDGLTPLVLTDPQLEALAATMLDPTSPGGWTGETTNADNPSVAAGYTYLAQFVDHDITFDPATAVERAADRRGRENFRTPRYDLDSVYGLGPRVSPHLYDDTDPAKLLIAGPAGPTGLAGRDLPRNHQGRALLGDPRNDVHAIICQLHLAFLAFHNAVVDHVRANPSLLAAGENDFDAASRLVRHHYQWIVLTDLLPRIVGPATAAAVLRRRGNGRLAPALRLYNLRRNAYIPVEFSAAAYRFGHSTVRDAYELNASSGQIPVFAADAAGRDLRGFRTLDETLRIEWHRFFPGLAPAGAVGPQPSMRIDPRLAPSLTHPPAQVDAQRRSLALLNLFRGQHLGLPSGEDAAAAAAVVPGMPAPLTTAVTGLQHPSPLWFYVLKEAEHTSGGAHLGPFGGRVVAEVLVGLAAKDKTSVLGTGTRFVPSLPAAAPGEFTIADLLRLAGAA